VLLQLAAAVAALKTEPPQGVTVVLGAAALTLAEPVVALHLVKALQAAAALLPPELAAVAVAHRLSVSGQTLELLRAKAVTDLRRVSREPQLHAWAAEVVAGLIGSALVEQAAAVLVPSSLQQ